MTTLLDVINWFQKANADELAAVEAVRKALTSRVPWPTAVPGRADVRDENIYSTLTVTQTPAEAKAAAKRWAKRKSPAKRAKPAVDSGDSEDEYVDPAAETPAFTPKTKQMRALWERLQLLPEGNPKSVEELTTDAYGSKKATVNKRRYVATVLAKLMAQPGSNVKRKKSAGNSYVFWTES